MEGPMSKSGTMSAVFAAGAICALTATTTNAAELKVSGTVAHVIVSSESQKLDDGRTILHVHVDKGIVEANDPKSPLHLTWRDCSGTLIMDAKGNFVDGAGHCENFDKSGDGYWNTWNLVPEGGNKWSVYHGTGKFEGMSGGGTSKVIANFPDRYVISYEGTLTMK
jgi:hypothetical protein